MLWKYFEKSNAEIIFKRDKMVFSNNNGVQKAIYWSAGRNIQKIMQSSA